jgi:hypothetical protein
MLSELGTAQALIGQFNTHPFFIPDKIPLPYLSKVY